jgi:hypothetical protein
VAHTQAIDNFEWYETKQLYNLGAYLRDVWGASEVFISEDAALFAAHKLAKQYEVLEYGVSSIDTDYVFYGDM